MKLIDSHSFLHTNFAIKPNACKHFLLILREYLQLTNCPRGFTIYPALILPGSKTTAKAVPARRPFISTENVCYGNKHGPDKIWNFANGRMHVNQKPKILKNILWQNSLQSGNLGFFEKKQLTFPPKYIILCYLVLVWVEGFFLGG